MTIEYLIYIVIHAILFPLFLPASPFIFVIIKFLGVVKPKNEWLKKQSMVAGKAEAILEAAPQLGLQIYIALLTMKPSLNQKLSILTSAATISLPIIETYVSSRGMDFGFKSIMQNFLVSEHASSKNK